MIQRSLTLAAGLVLSACQQPAADDNIAIDSVNGAEAAAADVEILPPSESSDPPPPGNAAAASVINEAEDRGSGDPAQGFFPAQYRGRWGMVPADCTSTRGDAKGLIVIGDTTVKFYESLANLQERQPAIATSFAGRFRFTGEGQTWEKIMTFTRTGDTLKRADEEGSYTYKLC